MAGFFYNLGRMAGPGVRKGKWVWQAMTGTEEEIIAAEAEVGRDLAAEMIQACGLCGDARDRALIEDIGGKLRGCVKNRLRQFSFTAIGGEEVNAFALPGGHVFVTRPLIELVGGAAAELAFILGHEMAHVIKQDPMRRIVTDATLSAAMRVTPTGRVAGPWLKDKALHMLRSAYSQDQELMADKLGARLAMAAGYDAAAGPRMLARLGTLSARQELPLAEYFSTHPPIEMRVGELDQYLRTVR